MPIRKPVEQMSQEELKQFVLNVRAKQLERSKRADASRKERGLVRLTLYVVDGSQEAVRKAAEQAQVEYLKPTFSSDEPAESEPTKLPFDEPAESEPTTLPFDEPAESEPTTLPFDEPAESEPTTLPFDQPAESEPTTLPFDQPAESEPTTLPFDVPAASEP